MKVSIIITILLLMAGIASANDYYVNSTGSDASGNGSASSPWKTLNHAVSSVAANQGHTINISSGIFIENGPINIPAGVNISGAGINSTIIKANSSFYYNPATPGYSYDKFLIRLFENNATSGNQTLKNFKIDGDGKRLHGGIYVKFRNNVKIENLEVTGTNFTGIWLFDVKDSYIKNTRFVNCSWGSTGYSVGALNLGNVERVLIDNVYIDEDTGYGIKAIGPSGYNDITELRILNSHVTVNPYGLWNNGQAPNIAIELWQADLIRCEIANTYVDNTISLINANANPSTGIQTIRVHHNVLDMVARAGGSGYAIELTIHDAEVDHNYIYKGRYAIANWDNPMQNWEIHHNTVYAISGTYPGEIVRSQWSGLHNVNLYNNTIEFDSDKTTSIIGVYGGSSENINVKNNLFIDSKSGSYNYYASQFVHLENGASMSGLVVQNNLFKDLPVGSVNGTYSNNITNVDPMITNSGARPDPYYIPKSGSPLIDAGLSLGYAYEGNAPDIGAYEYGGSSSVPVNKAPTVSLTSPTNNASFDQGTAINMAATAADSDGSIAKVEFFNGTTKLGEDLTSPYSYAWNNAAAGDYILTAKAIDNNGLATTSTGISISVVTVALPNVAPTVSLTSPANNASFDQGNAINMAATAADSDGSITKVEFFNGATKLGEDLTSPYTYAWSNATAGNYTLTAKATDNNGLAATSTGVNISVVTVALPNVAPTVSLTSPANNANFDQGTAINMVATAADSDGSITKVEFYNGATKLGEDLTSPYSYAWNNAAAGDYTLTAKATDNNGLATTSTGVNISVVTVALPNVAPTVSLTSPANNASYNEESAINMTATATDSDGSIAKVEFYNGATKLGEDLTSPYSYAWNNATAGNYTLTARATDNEGFTTTSTGTNISVNGISNQAATVVITSPKNNEIFTPGTSVIISASATVKDGYIKKVRFYNGSSRIYTDFRSPYRFTWNNMSEGNYTIIAKAYDNKGNVAISEPISFSVTSEGVASGTTLGLDAKDAALTGIMTLGQDASAIENTFFTIPVGSGKNYYIPPSARANFKFVLPEGDNYEMWIRVKSPDINNGSLYVYDGNGKWYVWYAGHNENWTWVKVTQSINDEIIKFPFIEGNNAFSIGWLHENVMVDHIFVTNNPNFDPNQANKLGEITATEEGIQQDYKVLLYPNPVVDKFKISFNTEDKLNSDEGEIIITDLSMRQVMKQPMIVTPGLNEVEINVSDFKSGIYILTVKSSDFNIKKRLMIAK